MEGCSNLPKVRIGMKIAELHVTASCKHLFRFVVPSHSATSSSSFPMP